MHAYACALYPQFAGKPRDTQQMRVIIGHYRFGSRSKVGKPSGIWWNGCLSTV
jgi:hypothetical protein